MCPGYLIKPVSVLYVDIESTRISGYNHTRPEIDFATIQNRSEYILERFTERSVNGTEYDIKAEACFTVSSVCMYLGLLRVILVS